jgi:NitT/TauT family transport system substrate-binding protein
MRFNPPARSSRATALAAFALLAFAPAVCRAQSTQGAVPAAPLVHLRLANLGVASGPQEMAIERGVFAHHGIDLEVVHFIRGGAEATVGAASGQVDMGEYGSPILIGIASGLHLKIVGAPPVKTNGFELVARKGIESVKDLRGKTVAAGALGNGTYEATIKILHDSGLTDSDVNLVTGNGVAADLILRSGRVDAVITTGLIRLKLVDEGHANLIARASDYFGHYEHSYIYATDGFIQAHPEAVHNFLLATREAWTYAKDHREELVEFAAKGQHVKKEIARAYYDEMIPQWDLSLNVDREGMANAVRILQELKEIRPNATFDLNSWLDLRFLDDASHPRTAAIAGKP